jgi:hypothetical protein
MMTYSSTGFFIADTTQIQPIERYSGENPGDFSSLCSSNDISDVISNAVRDLVTSTSLWLKIDGNQVVE